MRNGLKLLSLETVCTGVCASVCDSSHDLFNISLDVCGGVLEVIIHDVVRVKAILSGLRGLLSIVVMALLKKTNLFSMIGVSMAGGLAHNLGQLLVAAFLVSNIKMFIYFPVLMFSGIASGIVIGIVSYIIDGKLPKYLFR